MKRLLKLILLFINAVAFAQSNARIMESQSMVSNILAQELKYSIILPEDYYTTTKSYPVVFLLHGLGDNESSWLEYGRVSQYADDAVKRNEIIPMIFVMPQGYRNYYVNDYTGKFLYEDMFIKEFVPFIDKTYRTISNKAQRATMGYSMGGYGALILPLKNPDVFTISVPLSISIRTDQQYMKEDASGWDDQWGRLFGGVGQSGEDRLTDYYKEHSPFYIFTKENISSLKNLKLYIDNGDDEQTLCRSNEELHMLLRDINFSHEFRVRNGGHEFSYWRDALPNGLRFISDAFEMKPYRGDINLSSLNYKVLAKTRNSVIHSKIWSVALPEEYQRTQRLYPAIYFLGNIDRTMREAIVQQVYKQTQSGSLAPIILIFLNDYNKLSFDSIFPSLEKEFRIRAGYRFRALIGFENGGGAAMRYAILPEMFTSCVVFNGDINGDELNNAIATNNELSRTWYYISNPDKGLHYRTNGNAHIVLREAEVYHEYRVSEGNGGTMWFLHELTDALNFTLKKIHR